MRLIFSKDRAAQLDLLLRSLGRYAPEERTRVICAASTQGFRRGYGSVMMERPDVEWRIENGARGFRIHLAFALDDADEDGILRLTPKGLA